MARRFVEFQKQFCSHFISQGRNSVHHARHYLTGLLGTERRKNIEAIEGDVAGSDYQGMEQFISSSPWDHRGLMADVAREADAAIGDPVDAALTIG